MGQVAGKTNSFLTKEERVPYNKGSKNGFIFMDKYIPVELLMEILTRVDYKSLLNCQSVCKDWNILIQKCVWKKKAEMTIGHLLPYDDKAPWIMYYYICDKKFDKNLISNHSGKKGLPRIANPKHDWHIIESGGDGWAVECPPAGVPDLPEDPVFEGQSHCFVTSYYKCWKYQTINLIEEGINEHFLDSLQPTIKISEYYSSRWDCGAVYVCTIELFKEDDVVIDSYSFTKTLEGEDQNQWFKFEHEFKNYGPGLRKIRFCHGGRDRRFWAGHYGSKMAGACIKLEVPVHENTVNKEEEEEEEEENV